MIINTSIGGKSSLEDGSVTTNKIADNAVTFNKLSADARPIGMNLLDNWYFVGGGSQQGGEKFPINQNGNTEYTGGKSYCIDRWVKDSGVTLIINEDGLLITSSSASGRNGIAQPLEFEHLRGRKMALSALVKGSPGAEAFLGYSADKISYSPSLLLNGEWQLISYTFSLSSLATKFTPFINCKFTSNFSQENLIVAAAKLEFGDHQTLASQDEDGNWIVNEIPDYGEELAKCQREYVKMTRCLVSGFLTTGATEYVMNISVPVSMRANPTISMGGYYARGISGYSKHTPSGTFVAPTNLNLYVSGHKSNNIISIVDKIPESVGDPNNTPMEYVIMNLELDSRL